MKDTLFEDFDSIMHYVAVTDPRAKLRIEESFFDSKPYIPGHTKRN